MSIKEKLIYDIGRLPEDVLIKIARMIREMNVLNPETNPEYRPVYGSGKGLGWMSDDFDEPLEELKEYME